MVFEVISLVLNCILGGGLIVTVVTLKSARRKAGAEARELELRNVESSINLVIEKVVPPLEKRIEDLEAQLKKNSDEYDFLLQVIRKAFTCRYRDRCPVLHELQDDKRSCSNDVCGRFGACAGDCPYEPAEHPVKRGTVKRSRARHRNTATGSGDEQPQ
jgi:hypothetical protein